jgi:hypothetical protein
LTSKPPFAPATISKQQKHPTMPAQKPIKKDAVLEKAIAGYTKDPSIIDIFSAKDKVYSKKVNQGLHDHLPASSVKVAEEEVESLLNVSSVQDQDYVSKSFGSKSRIVEPKALPRRPNDPVLEKALQGYTPDLTKMSVFTAEDKVYAAQVNNALSHHMPPSELKKGLPEQAPAEGPKMDFLLNVANPEDTDYISRTFGAKSRQ